MKALLRIGFFILVYGFLTLSIGRFSWGLTALFIVLILASAANKWNSPWGPPR